MNTLFFNSLTLSILLTSNVYAMETQESNPFATGGLIKIDKLILKSCVKKNILARLPENNEHHISTYFLGEETLAESLFHASDSSTPHIIRLISIDDTTKNQEYFINPQTAEIELSNTKVDENGNITQLDPRVDNILKELALQHMMEKAEAAKKLQQIEELQPIQKPKRRSKKLSLSSADWKKTLGEEQLQQLLNQHPELLNIFEPCEIGIYKALDRGNFLEVMLECKTDKRDWGWNCCTAKTINIEKTKLLQLGWKE